MTPPVRVGCTELVKVFTDGHIVVKYLGRNEFLIEFPRQPGLQVVANATDIAMAFVMLSSDHFPKDDQDMNETVILSDDHPLVTRKTTEPSFN